MVNITYYLDVVSSWCFYSESTWALLKSRYGEVATFDSTRPSRHPAFVEQRARLYEGLRLAGLPER